MGSPLLGADDLQVDLLGAHEIAGEEVVGGTVGRALGADETGFYVF